VPKRSHPPPWLFAVTCIPYGVVGAFASTLLPLLAKQAGFDLGSIGWLVIWMLAPSWIQFLYAPIVDVGPKRKHWLVIMSAISAAFLLAACVISIKDHRAAFMSMAVSAQFLSGLVSACNGGLMAVLMPDELRGRTGAWYNIGNLSGGALAVSVALWMMDAGYDGWSYGSVLAVMMFVPSLAILLVEEPPRDHVQKLGELFGITVHDVGEILISRKGISGVLLCLSPVGTAALVNYFAGMADDYHASSTIIWVVNGWANGVLTAVGALVGGYLCDRYDRRLMYLFSGVATAVCAIAMALSPRTGVTYTWGVMAYFVITGVSYASFSAMVLETIGDAGKAASTQYALFTAAGNIAITWVGFLDTRFDNRWHVEGVLGSDAALNLIGVFVLVFVFWRLGVLGKWRRPRAATSS
jgi:MFS family permease